MKTTNTDLRNDTPGDNAVALRLQNTAVNFGSVQGTMQGGIQHFHVSTDNGIASLEAEIAQLKNTIATLSNDKERLLRLLEGIPP